MPEDTIHDLENGKVCRGMMGDSDRRLDLDAGRVRRPDGVVGPSARSRPGRREAVKLILVMSLIMASVFSAAAKEVSCKQYGNRIHCPDGRSFTVQGSSITGDNGTVCRLKEGRLYCSQPRSK